MNNWGSPLGILKVLSKLKVNSKINFMNFIYQIRTTSSNSSFTSRIVVFQKIRIHKWLQKSRYNQKDFPFSTQSCGWCQSLLHLNFLEFLIKINRLKQYFRKSINLASIIKLLDFYSIRFLAQITIFDINRITQKLDWLNILIYTHVCKEVID